MVELADTDYYSATHGWWIPDMELECFVGKHRALTIVAGVLGIPIFIFLPPIYIFCRLYWVRGSLLTQPVMDRFLWLYYSYRPTMYWWEVLKMVDTLLWVAALSLGTSLDDTARSLLLLCVVMTSLTVVLVFRPHRFKTTLRLEVLGTCSNMVALMLLIFAADREREPLSRDKELDQHAMIVTAVVVVEVMTIMWYLMEIVRTAREKMKFIVVTSVATGRNLVRSLSRNVSGSILNTRTSGGLASIYGG